MYVHDKKPYMQETGRGERIWTSDILLPKQARYQAALRPVWSFLHDWKGVHKKNISRTQNKPFKNAESKETSFNENPLERLEDHFSKEYP